MRRALPAALVVLTALLLQTCVVAALPLPGATPDLLVVVVVAYALAAGPQAGLLTGFGTGLLADLLGDHPLGRLALAYGLVGCAAGTVEHGAERSTAVPLVTGALAAAGAVLVFAGEGVLLGDPRVTLGALGRSLLSEAAYAVLLAPLVVPLVAALVRRTDPESTR